MTDSIPASRAVPRPRRLRDCVLRVVAVCLLLFALRRQVYASIYFFFGMANDQSGYAPPLSEYSGAVINSPSDCLFTISLAFGDDLVRQLAVGAQETGLGRIAK